jgi:hypothetical protein
MKKYLIAKASYQDVYIFLNQEFNNDSDVVGIAAWKSGVVLATDVESILNAFQSKFILSEIQPKVFFSMFAGGQLDGLMTGHNIAIHSLTNQAL